LNTFTKIWDLVEPKKGLKKIIGFGLAQAFLELSCLFMLGNFISMLSLGEQIKVFRIMEESYLLTFNFLAFLLCFLFFLKLIFGIHNLALINNFSSSIESELKYRLLCNYQNMTYVERVKRGIGEMFDTIYGCTASFARAVVAPAVRVVSDSFTALVIVCYFIYLYPKIVTSFAIFLISIIFIWDKTLKKKSISYANNFRELSSQVSDELHDALIGYKEIIALNLTEYFAKKFKAKIKFMTSELAKSVTLSQSPRLVIEAILVIVAVFSLLIATTAGIDYQTEVPNIAILAVGLLRLATLMNLSSTVLANLRTYMPVINTLHHDLKNAKLFFTDVHIDKSNEVYVQRILANGIDIGFSEGQVVINNLTFEIHAGEKIALVGPSGSGKSTLLNTLIGLLKPTNGELKILFNNGSINDNLLGLASYLSQETFILADSIRRNVAIGHKDDDIDDELVMASLRRAQLSEFADIALLDKKLGSFGAVLSGGQRQRISLARAFYLKRKVLIFDESTSALDYETENEIVDQILNLGDDITVIFVTHRTNVADRFDKKFILNNS
jgi:ABC-type multidrug transport system fused ATPase/permease subunit